MQVLFPLSTITSYNLFVNFVTYQVHTWPDIPGSRQRANSALFVSPSINIFLNSTSNFFKLHFSRLQSIQQLARWTRPPLFAVYDPFNTHSLFPALLVDSSIPSAPSIPSLPPNLFIFRGQARTKTIHDVNPRLIWP